jgi:hypothetical protein
MHREVRPAADLFLLPHASRETHKMAELYPLLDPYIKVLEDYLRLVCKLWLERVNEELESFALPAEHRRRLRTSNPLERLNEEIKRRTRVATLFPNEASLLRLVTAILQETSEDWETGKSTSTWKPTNPPHQAHNAFTEIRLLNLCRSATHDITYSARPSAIANARTSATLRARRPST